MNERRRNSTSFSTHLRQAPALHLAKRAIRNIAWVIAFWLSAGPVLAQQSIAKAPWEIDLTIANPESVPFATLAAAEGIASKMFETAGVRPYWKSPRRNAHRSECTTKRLAIEIFFAPADHVTGKARGTLAYTYPYDPI